MKEFEAALSIPISQDRERLALLDRLVLSLDKKFGNNHPFAKAAHGIRYNKYKDGMSQRIAAVDLIRLVLTDLELADEKPSRGHDVIDVPISSTAIFVIHGRDEEMKQAVARSIEALGLQPIILHEQVDKGKTIIEKFHDFSQVNFAVALLSPDDLGRLRGAPADRERPRPRQNVVFELGFFLGKLGRHRVMALVRSTPEMDLPSDYAGVLFKNYDDPGNWRFELCRELREAGYKVDANNLLA